MKKLFDIFPRSFGTMLVVALLVSGCRTYGAYDNEEKTLGEIHRTTTLFEAEYEKARGNLNTLEAAAASSSQLAPFAESYAAVVEVQETVIEEHRAMVEEAEENDGDYRVLHRTYGAIISDHQIIRDRYATLLADMQHAMDSTAGYMVAEAGRFQVAPQFYDRIAHANARRSMTDILAMTRSGNSTRVAPEPSTPDTTAVN